MYRTESCVETPSFIDRVLMTSIQFFFFWIWWMKQQNQGLAQTTVSCNPGFPFLHCLNLCTFPFLSYCCLVWGYNTLELIKWICSSVLSYFFSKAFLSGVMIVILCVAKSSTKCPHVQILPPPVSTFWVKWCIPQAIYSSCTLFLWDDRISHSIPRPPRRFPVLWVMW